MEGQRVSATLDAFAVAPLRPRTPVARPGLRQARRNGPVRLPARRRARFAQRRADADAAGSPAVGASAGGISFKPATDERARCQRAPGGVGCVAKWSMRRRTAGG